jgi:hypothetical protein
LPLSGLVRAGQHCASHRPERRRDVLVTAWRPKIRRTPMIAFPAELRPTLADAIPISSRGSYRGRVRTRLHRCRIAVPYRLHRGDHFPWQPSNETGAVQQLSCSWPTLSGLLNRHDDAACTPNAPSDSCFQFRNSASDEYTSERMRIGQRLRGRSRERSLAGLERIERTFDAERLGTDGGR